MGTLSQETQLVQNPALGAMLLWRFAAGYERGSTVRAHVPIPLIFLVLPIMLQEDTVQLLDSTRQSSGIRAFVGKFSDSKVSKNDIIFNINEKALTLRNLSTQSLRVALSANLVAIDPSRAVVICLSLTPPQSRVPQSIRSLLRNAEKMGYWCSEISLHEVSLLLKVRF